MLRFNSCPKCKGTLVLDKDLYGWYEECIQCGYMHDMKAMVQRRISLDMKEVNSKSFALKGHETTGIRRK